MSRHNTDMFRCHLPALRRLLLLLWLFALFFGGCEAFRPAGLREPGVTPTFTDDADRASLIQATKRQLDYLKRLPGDKVVRIDGDPYTIAWMAESLRLFLDILEQNPSDEELDAILHDKFRIYQAGGRENAPPGEMLITGYYQPIVKGSLVKKPPYLYPLYSKPRSLRIRKDAENGKPIIGRIDAHGKMVPFWTRAEIEDRNLLVGSELVYLVDPVEVFFLQIQGSGLIELPNGTLRGVHISATNGREYRSIGKLLIDEGKLGKEGVSTPRIKQYLHEHPEERKRILQYNSKYIFFKWDKKEAEGCLGQILTPGRSIAVDREALPMTAVGYLITRRPVVNQEGTMTGWQPLHRFVLPQDTGEAIKGTGRVDFFWGSDRYAAAAAGLMKEKGTLYFLVKKRE